MHFSLDVIRGRWAGHSSIGDGSILPLPGRPWECEDKRVDTVTLECTAVVLECTTVTLECTAVMEWGEGGGGVRGAKEGTPSSDDCHTS